MNMVQMYAKLKRAGKVRVGGSGVLPADKLAALGVVADEVFLSGSTVNAAGDRERFETSRINEVAIKAEREQCAAMLADYDLLLADIEAAKAGG